MEHQLWTAIIAALAGLGKPRFNPRADYADHDVIHDRHVPAADRRVLEGPAGRVRARRWRQGECVQMASTIGGKAEIRR